MSHYLIVGGSSGIGLALTEILSQQGHSITAISRTSNALDGLANVTHYPCDISTNNPEFAKVKSHIDGLAYLPGTITLKPFSQLKIEDYQNDFNVNVLGAVKVIKQYLPQLLETENGSIVLMSSVAAGKGFPMHCSISAAKNAVTGFMRGLASEYAPKLRVNAVAPSLTETPLTSSLLDSEAKKEGSAKKHPMKRVGNPNDIAEMIAFLLSSKSRWMTGQLIGVDGGISTL
ncbi:MAG: SDR family oxidoreductase [Simkaniaceae bacterium]|nr:SDR family oxidoreductase [Simkaniaceae bacterium]